VLCGSTNTPIPWRSTSTVTRNSSRKQSDTVSSHNSDARQYRFLRTLLKGVADSLGRT